MATEGRRNPYSGKGWIKVGLTWGAFMVVVSGILLPLQYGEEITATKLVLNVVGWSIGGLIFGYLMKLLTTWAWARRERRQQGKS